MKSDLSKEILSGRSISDEFSSGDSKSRKFSFRKVSIGGGSQDSRDLKNYIEDVNLIYSKDDKFIGTFNHDKQVVIERKYLEHTPQKRLYYTKVYPKNKTLKLQLIIVHGFTCSSNFMELAIKLAKKGLSVNLFDMCGFGYSYGVRFNGRMRYFVEDLHRIVLECYNDLPLFLFGHSLGATVIVDYLTFNNKIRIAGVILTSPMLVVPIYWRFSIPHTLVFNIFGTLWDELVINTNFNSTNFAKNNFTCTRISHFLRNCTHVGIGLIRDVVRSISTNKRKLEQFKYPIMILHGRKNMSIPHEDMLKMMDKIGSKDKILKIVENGYIELYCDDEKEALCVVVLDWIKNRSSKAPSLGNLSRYVLKYHPKKDTVFSLRNAALLLVYLIVVRYLSKIPKYNDSRWKLFLFPVYWIFKVLKVFFNKQVAIVNTTFNTFKSEVFSV